MADNSDMDRNNDEWNSGGGTGCCLFWPFEILARIFESLFGG